MKLKFNGILVLLVVLVAQLTFAQERAVSGVVSDNAGLPLPGVSVLVKGTNTGTQTDFDGKYSIRASSTQVLIFSYIGMKTQQMSATTSTLNVKLKDDSIELEGVVVGALGIKRKQDAVTSSSQVVKTKELTQAANPNIVQSLTGKVSGLQINTTSNGVNPNTRIVLRGSRSISGNNQALVVIDNAVSTAAVLQQLPPETVESINIIKGQQGGALYGEQGSNGVIIVTTKKGTANSKLSVSVNSSVDFEQVAYLPQRQTKYGQGWYSDQGFLFGDARDGQNFVAVENGAWGPAFNNPDFAGTQVPVGLPQADGNFLMTDWKSLGSDNIKDFFKTGTIIQNGITLNAGGEDGYALLNVNKQTSEFVVEGDQLKRTSFLFKAGKKIGKFSVDGNINYTNQSVTQTTPDLYDDLLQAATNIPVTQFANSGHVGHWTVYGKNPYEYIKQIRFDDKSDLFNGILNLGYEFNKHISVNYTGNVQLRSTISESHDDGFFDIGYEYDFAPYDYYGQYQTYEGMGGTAETSSYYRSQSKTRNIYSDFLINFDYDLTEDINMKLNIGNNIQDSNFNTIEQGGINLDTPGYYNINNVNKPANPSTLSNFSRVQRKVAAFANADFSYKNYLFLNATGRYEQSSTVKDPFFYPSVGVSFIPTKAFESLKESGVLSYAKLSASYVRIGNTTPVAPYKTSITGVIAPGFSFGDLAGYQFDRAGVNSAITPEFVTTKEANISLGFLKDRITLEASYYIADTKDLITASTSSTTSGLVSILDNTGDLQNKGYEIDLGVTPFKSDSFTWNMRGSYATSKTVVKALSAGVDQVNLFSNTHIGVFAEVGEEFPILKGTAYVRDPEGRIIVGSNGIPERTSTFEKLGKTTPDYILGFTNTFNFKGLALTVVADYRTGHSFYSEGYRRMATFGYSEESASQDRSIGYVVPNSVQQTTPTSGVFVTNTTPVNGGGYTGVGDYFTQRYVSTGESLILDATALKIKEIALSYNLPSQILKRTGLESVKVGVNARNPFVILSKNNKGYADPESANTGGNAAGIANVGQYPTTRTYGFSINLTF
ncbi:SusC/RagA family TonB-linked outer membrane protein [Flavobacterium sp. W20_MBD1_R3]|uniref:SusC/RagA family TonB-linked outer membrane protein n=1 Tax=Flavobacterium sp. W20_MBD1_R3 TaxID=3240278 RepID=UPI003F9210BC